ncbi:MAG: enoyl-CoA hydratase/isomerase family protein [Rhodospirillaceae bacterium]|nr:MAG: enoyl-CoA hydratase/isomerase family protein [Rhodospirillaceae bacterium]
MKKYAHYTTMTFSLQGRILTVTLNNPEKLNIFTEKMEQELTQFFVDGAMDEDFDFVILTGAGRAFSAGGDVENWMTANVADPGRVNTDLSKRVVFSILDFPKPLIAKLPGHAIGLGATVALFCDVIFASNDAKIADPHVRLGLSAGDGGAIIWPQLIGYARAREFLMTGELIPAPRAAAMGLINYALPPEELDAAVDAFVQKLSKGALVAIRATKMTVNLGLKQVATAVMDASIAYEKLTVYTKDHAEAVDAFLNKRKPNFIGK